MAVRSVRGAGARGRRPFPTRTLPTPSRPTRAAFARHICAEVESDLETSGEKMSAAGRSEEHTSELQSLMRISYAVFCLKKKNTTRHTTTLSPATHSID